MEKMLKQNLRKVVIYENKPRPAARGRSQNTASEGCKYFNNYQYYNQARSQGRNGGNCLPPNSESCTKNV